MECNNIVNRDTKNLSSASSINQVSIKVPTFIPADPELWFVMLESIFYIAGITQDSTKFGHVLDALDQRYILEVRDVLLRPREEQSYELLKTELIKRLGEQNTRRRLENEPLGDRQPSQFLRHLRGLAGIECPEDVLQTVWLEICRQSSRLIEISRSTREPRSRIRSRRSTTCPETSRRRSPHLS